VAEQMDGAGGRQHAADVRAQLLGPVGGRVVRALRLVLPSHVDGDDPAAGRGERSDHQEEVFLAARVAGNQQGRSAFA
jgi:hypothetical protein